MDGSIGSGLFSSAVSIYRPNLVLSGDGYLYHQYSKFSSLGRTMGGQFTIHLVGLYNDTGLYTNEMEYGG